MVSTTLSRQTDGRITERHSNFEVLRIFSMLVIVACHITTQGIGIYKDGTLLNKIIAASFYPGGIIGVPLFFMLTGYFLVGKKRTSLKKVFLETIFYGWGLAFFLCIPYCMDKLLGFNFNYCSAKAIFRKIINPISSGRWWFVTSYSLLVLVVPYINGFLEKLNKAGFKFFIFITWFFWYFGVSVFGTYIEISIAFFFFLLGAYFRLYGPTEINKFLHLFFIMVLWFLIAAAYYYTNTSSQNSKASLINLISNIILTPLASWSFFSFFASLKIRKNRIINTVAATTFGVYLIHVSSIKTIFYRDIFHVDAQYSSELFPFYAILDIIFIFSVCSFIDWLRLKFIEPKMLIFADKLFEKLRAKFFVDAEHR